MNKELKSLFERQKIFQSILNDDDPNEYPRDDVQLFSTSTLLAVEEIGELLKADKRWRSFRGDKFDSINKSEEMADIFIVFMNILMYSGMSIDDLMDAVSEKIDINMSRVIKSDIVKDSDRS